MKIVSRFRCERVAVGHVVCLEPVGPPDGHTGLVVGTGRGPCELGKISDPSDFVVDGIYEITITRVEKKKDDAPGG